MLKRALLICFLVGLSNFCFAEESPTLIGGKPVAPGEYPEVIYISMKGGKCSASIVGPRTVLTAAHCARKGAKVTFQHNQNQYTAICNAPAAYPRQDHDISVCLVDKELAKPYASLASEGPKTGDNMSLIGYGCTRPGGGGGNDGVLRVGQSTVTGFSTWDIITKKNSALCYGDSGGPAFKLIGDPVNEHHYVLGVNSKGDIRSTSYLSKIYSDASKAFLTAWAEQNKAEICGLNLDCATPPPPKLCEKEYFALDAAHKQFDKALDELKFCLFTPTVSVCSAEINAVKEKHPAIADAFLKLDTCLMLE